MCDKEPITAADLLLREQEATVRYTKAVTALWSPHIERITAILAARYPSFTKELKSLKEKDDETDRRKKVSS